MMAQAALRRWREVKGRPVQGNSPNDRILRGPDCNRHKRVCVDSFPATPSPQLPGAQKVPGMRFFRHGGIYRSDGVLKTIKDWGRVPPPVGRPRGPAKGRDGRRASCSSSAMSSDRLFLDRVARQHCPSPLHRHTQTTTHPLPAPSKPDISTLQRIGHFYFALTSPVRGSGVQSSSRSLLFVKCDEAFRQGGLAGLDGLGVGLAHSLAHRGSPGLLPRRADEGVPAQRGARPVPR
jgi:hypothetical protein